MTQTKYYSLKRAGQPFIEVAIGNATQTNFEAFYNFPVSDNITITPIQVINNAANRGENGAIFTGTLRAIFFLLIIKNDFYIRRSICNF